MPYVTAITDRVLTDVTNLTSKGYFNVADWSRIEGNVYFVRDELQTSATVIITLYGSASTPTIISIFDITIFNTLLQNINLLREKAIEAYPFISGSPGLITIPYLVTAFNYVSVNQWETVIDIIHTELLRIAASRFRFPRTGVAAANTELTWNNRFRG